MQEQTERELNKYLDGGTKGYTYLVEAVESYDAGSTALRDIYKTIAAKHNTTPSAVARTVDFAVNGIEADRHFTPKAFIAYIKERILLNNDE